MIKTLEVFGTEYEMGFKIGNLFKDYLKQAIVPYNEKIKIVNVYTKVKEMEQQLKLHFPKCLDEIYGRADGAKVSKDALLLMFFPEIYNGVDGCTTVIFKKSNGNFLFSHNEDDKNFNTENVALVKYNYGDYWITGYTMAERLTGSAFSYNSYGLVFSSNYIQGTKFVLNNISRYIAVRDIITSKSLEEVICKLKNFKTASAFSLNILDKNLNKAINVEKDIDKIYITNIEDRYARANHFTAKNIELSAVPPSSIFRDKKSNELVGLLDNKQAAINDIIEILNYETNDYYKCIYKDKNKYMGTGKSITVANFSYDNETKKIQIRDYLGDHVFNLNYDEF